MPTRFFFTAVPPRHRDTSPLSPSCYINYHHSKNLRAARSMTMDPSSLSPSYEAPQRFSEADLCDICRDAHFVGMFTDTDCTDGGYNPYRADLHPELQVPRTWQHIQKHRQMCTFCRLTYQQLQHYSATFSEAEENFEGPPEISIAEVTSAYLNGGEHKFPRYIGFHNGIYRHPEHKRLLIRGLQLAATCTSDLEGWTKWIHGIESDRRACMAEKLSIGRSIGGRSVNREYIDFDLCSRWFRLCNDEHEDCRGLIDMPVGAAKGPKRLIDVVEGRLIMTESKLKEAGYAALSYVWGCKPELWLVNKTNEYLQTAGSIVPTNERIPRTIRDALAFCRKTKIPYIWVDSFCIIQDDKADQAIEIPRMFEIYSQATVTLVAISGSSSRDPLPGVTPNTRLWHQYRGTVKGLDLITCYPALVTEIEKSTW
jgi:hypothetical protein